MQQEWVDGNFLASAQVGTPDPRREDPPQGQRLLIAWDFPRSLYREGLQLEAVVRFWDEHQEVLCLPLERKRGYKAYFFPDRKILTYCVKVVNEGGEVVEVWKHHFWTEEIKIRGSSSPRSRSSAAARAALPTGRLPS